METFCIIIFAEHKMKQLELEAYLRVAQTLRLLIEKAVDPKWLKTAKSPTLKFMDKMPKQMLNHLQSWMILISLHSSQ